MVHGEAGRSTPDVDRSRLLRDLKGVARQDRAELIEWLLERGFTSDEVDASSVPMLLPANRLLGDDGTYVSLREVASTNGIDIQFLDALLRAAGLPTVDDPDAAVLPRADLDAVARAKYLVDFGVDTEDVTAIMRVLMDGLGQAAAALREPTFKVLVEPGSSEIDLAESAGSLVRTAAPLFKEMVEALLMLQLRHMFEAEGITAVERATGELPGARHVAVAFADLTGFTRLGEVLAPNDLERVARRLGDLAHEIARPPVRFIKTIGDAVMFVSPETVQLIDVVLELIDMAAANQLPQLRTGIAAGLAISRAGDWYGSPVNIASRVTGLAEPGTVLVTDMARKSVSAADGLGWSPAGSRRIRGIPGRVRLYRVNRT